MKGIIDGPKEKRYIVGHILYFINPKFQASSHLLLLYSPDCVGPSLKSQRQVFSQRGSYYNITGMYVTFVYLAINNRKILRKIIINNTFQCENKSRKK